MFDTFKQLKQLREQAHKIDEILRQVEITKQSTDGQITLRMNGKQEILSLDISSEAKSKDSLAHDIQSLVNEAVTESQKQGALAMRSIPGMPSA